MNKYQVIYCNLFEGEDNQVFQCLATDEEHAREQCCDAEPDAIIVAVKRVKETASDFDKYDARIRKILTTLALVKPPKGSCSKEVKKYIKERLQEFGII